MMINPEPMDILKECQTCKKKMIAKTPEERKKFIQMLREKKMIKVNTGCKSCGKSKE